MVISSRRQMPLEPRTSENCSASSGGRRLRWSLIRELREALMKPVTFETAAKPRLGAVVGERVVPLDSAAHGLATEMVGLIAAWPEVEEMVRGIAEAGEGAVRLDQVGRTGPNEENRRVRSGRGGSSFRGRRAARLPTLDW